MVTVRCPSSRVLSRRRMLERPLRLLAGAGTGALAAAAAAACGGRLPLPLPGARVTPAVTLRVAVPVGGVSAWQNTRVQEAIDTVLPGVNGAAGGRFTLEVLPLEQPTPEPNRPAPAQAMVLAPSLGSGTPPDLVVLTGSSAPGARLDALATAADMRFVQPLDDHLKTNKTLLLQDFFPAALEQCRVKGRLVGVPLLATPLTLLYDKFRFERAGVARPTDAWDWARLLDAARRLTRDTDRDGVADDYGFFPGYGAGPLLAFIWQHGGEVVSADKKRALLAELAAREAIEFAADLYRGGTVSPPPPAPGTPTAMRYDQQGMRCADRWWIAMIYQVSGGWGSSPDWPVEAAELARDRQRATALSVMATLSVTSKTKDPAVAAAALATLGEALTRNVVPPARRMPVPALQALQEGLTEEGTQAKLNAMAYSRALVLDDQMRTQQLHYALAQLVAALQRGTRTPAEEAQMANANVQRLLDGAA